MPGRILVVDDSATVREQVTAALQGFDCIEAEDGEQGAQLLMGHLDIALVLCDVNMPRLTGLEMLQKVQSTLQQRGIKFVMLTTEGQPGLIQKAKELGAAGWVVKPFNPGQLRAVANKLVGAAPGSTRP